MASTATATAGSPNNNNNNSGKENSTATTKALALRRRRSKGTIAGYGAAAGTAGTESKGGSGSGSAKTNGTAGAGAANSEAEKDPSVIGARAGAGGDDASGSSDSPTGGGGGGGESRRPQHAAAAPPESESIIKPKPDGGGGGATAAAAAPKPCHSSRMALLCVQNAIYMGARTQLALCPPGRVRRKFAGRLRERKEVDKTGGSGRHLGGTSLTSSTGSSSMAAGVSASLSRGRLGRVTSVSSSSASASAAAAAAARLLAEDGLIIERALGEDGLRQYDAAEEECLANPDYFENQINSDGDELIEDPSSGDDDDLDAGGDDGRPPSSDPAAALRSYVHREPLHTPSGSDPASSAQNGAVGAMVGGSASSGKLPFNQRKMRWFDIVAASDRTAARQYLRTELSKLRKRDGAMLIKHLQMMQRRERRLIEKTGPSEASLSDEEEEDALQAMEQTAAALGVTSLPDDMTPSLSAALVLESLSLNHLESVEGMSKCYDAIVAAGTAILDAELDGGATSADGTATSPAGSASKFSFGSSGVGQTASKKKPTKSEIMAALAPVLITTLEQPAGEVILALANLRRMCGTRRYQRRFVQRVAPSLIRPPSGAMWCLRHQRDMEAILACAEMMFEMAHDIFSAGWHERGRQILADSVRAGALRAAAEQLKNLSSPQSSDSLITGLSGARLHGRGNALKKGATPSEGVEPLAEWEVLAVDVEIRSSINNFFSKDWSRQIATTHPVPRDDASVGSYRHRRGISSAKPKPVEGERPSEISSNALVPAAPSALLQPPPSPIAASLSPRSLHHKAPLPLSPASQMPPPASTQVLQPNSDGLESVFGPSFTSGSEGGMVAPGSPSSRKTHKAFVGDTTGTRSPPHTPTPTQHTPPRSPSNETRGDAGMDGSMVAAPQLPSMSSEASGAPLTPGRSAQLSQAVVHSPVPLSPMSVGAASYSSMDSNRITSGASVSSSVTGSQTAQQSAQTAYLRTLTSTAAERKRTVAACRALRAQISRFEEAFIQLHGRPPKGAAERAPLATTYAQYREWKRAIRADAACRIQALFRGARVRWMLLRSNNPRMSRVVLTRAGRPDFGSAGDASGTEKSDAMVPSGRGSQNHILNKISIPVEIGGDKAESLATPILTQKASPPASRVGSLGRPGENEINEGDVPDAPGQPISPQLSPNWSGNPPNLTVGKRMAADAPGPSGGPSPSSTSPSGRVPISNLTFGGVHMNDLPHQDLQARKRELKQQLKQYDMNFAKIHGRMPVKSEKEPIRHLYESYNALKARITYLEREGSNPISGPPMPYRRSSSDRGSLAHSSAGSVGSATSDASSGDEALIDIREPPRSSKRKDKSPSGASASPSAAGSSSQDLASLKAEKGQLHQMLRSYEKDFFKLHNRQVSSFSDIRPVASQYRRYKEIKKAIAAKQQGGGEK
eukprot:CAMPEP_0181070072 /NCGR_PEP_ID=MMETSP1070-20121207/27289_1 /TAXON_ID=265543 /ORGANISM="Minutocellus polymorphus, Strain NH13" /LENGTH=1421 /DNA_ID=CAMNT_0023150929 /DNA_START=232 /DNA_END=4498 /DNA_ORIENTATION=-